MFLCETIYCAFVFIIDECNYCVITGGINSCYSVNKCTNVNQSGFSNLFERNSNKIIRLLVIRTMGKRKGGGGQNIDGASLFGNASIDYEEF